MSRLTTFIPAGSSAAAASTASGSSRSLGLDVALVGTGGSLVDGLDGDGGLFLTIVVVACPCCGIALVERDKVEVANETSRSSGRR